MSDEAGSTPLALAARHGHTAVVQLLLASGHAAPRPADLLCDAIRLGHVDVARCLMAAEREAKSLLTVLKKVCDEWPDNRQLVLPLFATVSARLPLGRQDWQLVPSPCSGLATGLPVVLERSATEAGCLVARLPAAERSRLRLLALCLSRSRWGRLPTEILHKVLAAYAAAG
jgi:hypothetical protein